MRKNPIVPELEAIRREYRGEGSPSSKAIEMFGWYGAILVLLAYILLSLKIIEAGFIYQILNFTGSVGLLLVALKRKVGQQVLINGAWTLIALYALYVILK